MELIKVDNYKIRNRCISCGTYDIRPRRRYCTPQCRTQMLWVLSLSKGLLKAFNTQYATFFFNESHVVLDILPFWSDKVSRFSYKRKRWRKPAEDLKELILSSGEEWYRLVNNTSKSHASHILLSKNHTEEVLPQQLKPDKSLRPRLTPQERKSIRLLKLKAEELLSDGHIHKIKAAYKKLAKLYHPDVGGDEELFKKINEAHEQLLMWARNPQYTSRRALKDLWSYDGRTNRWTPPL